MANLSIDLLVVKMTSRSSRPSRSWLHNEKNESIIECDENYFRPLDVNTLLGDAKKARKKLKWKPKENIYSLIDKMILSEYLSFNEIEKK